MSEPQISTVLLPQHHDSNDALGVPDSLEKGVSKFQSTSRRIALFWRRFPGRLNWTLIAQILAIKGLVLLFAALSYPVLSGQALTRLRQSLEIWNRWDSLRYLRLAEFGYTNVGTDQYDIVGFPLYPLLVKLCAFIFQDYLVSGFVVSGLASMAAALLLEKLVRLDYADSVARASVWFLFIFPTSYFLHINYTESLFLALTLGSFLAARRGAWGIAAALGMLSCLTRVNGLVIIPALMVEASQQYREKRCSPRQFCWLLLVPAGFGFYLLLNKLVTGDWLAFVSANRENFYKSFAPPWVGIWEVCKVFWNNPLSTERAQMVGLQELIFIAIGAAGAIASLFLLRPVYTTWIAGNWLLFTSVGFILGVPRYTLTLFPLFILSASLAERPLWNQIMTVWSLLFLAFFINQFITGHWAFG